MNSTAYPRVLFVTDSSPLPVDNGSAQRTNLLLRAMLTFSEVNFLLVNRHDRVDSALLQEIAREFGNVEALHPWIRDPHGSKLRTWAFRGRQLLDTYAAPLYRLRHSYSPDSRVSHALVALTERCSPDVLVGRYLRPTILAGALDHTPLILDLDDHDVEHYRSRIQAPGVSWPRRMVAKAAVKQLETIVPSAIERCEHVWVTNREDRDRIDSRATILPNISFQQSTELAAPRGIRPGSIVMVGTLNYDVNVRSVEHFIGTIWPRIRASRPDARLRIVGSGMSEHLRRRWCAMEGVVPVGFVDDLAEEYRTAACAVAPIFEGGGTKIKVLEALSYGCPIVVTDHALRGYSHILKDREALRVGVDSTTFADACLDILNDDALAASLAAVGRNLVQDHFSWEQFRNHVEATVRTVTAGRARVRKRIVDRRSNATS